MHIYLGLGKGAGYVSDATGVVEVDVSDHDAGKFTGNDAELTETGEEDLDRALAARLDEDGARALDKVTGAHLLPAPEQSVDLDDAGSKVSGCHKERSLPGACREPAGNFRRARSRC